MLQCACFYRRVLKLQRVKLQRIKLQRIKLQKIKIHPASAAYTVSPTMQDSACFCCLYCFSNLVVRKIQPPVDRLLEAGKKWAGGQYSFLKVEEKFEPAVFNDFERQYFLEWTASLTARTSRIGSRVMLWKITKEMFQKTYFVNAKI